MQNWEEPLNVSGKIDLGPSNSITPGRAVWLLNRVLLTEPASAPPSSPKSRGLPPPPGPWDFTLSRMTETRDGAEDNLLPLLSPRPVILDPTDPTNNVGSGKRWDVMAKEAGYCLRQACCRSVQGWNVQVRTSPSTHLLGPSALERFFPFKVSGPRCFPLKIGSAIAGMLWTLVRKKD